MVGSLTIISWRLKPEFLRTTLLTTNALANISFLVSILASILVLAEIAEEERARKIMAYAFVAGIVLLVVSIALFSWIVASEIPWSYYD
jgi:apolipoprotein N-acyltransferase